MKVKASKIYENINIIYACESKKQTNFFLQLKIKTYFNLYFNKKVEHISNEL